LFLNSTVIGLEADPANAGMQFVSFSVGPDDGPSSLKGYVNNYYSPSDMTHWRILAADDQFLPSTAVSLGLAGSVKEIRDGLLPYSTNFYLVDAQGTLRGIYDAFSPDDVKKMKDDLRQLSASTTRPASPPGQIATLTGSVQR
jgi:cytochrome oxidase Cu insertion factor (SCO1/SenC/PrrC family)